MKIHTGMLESLGINMYTSIGKSLVEFIANGFDADASTVKLSIPSEEIQNARNEVKAAAKAQQNESRKGVYDPLPDNIQIVIEDDGHGMTIEELENRFLIVNRNRRDALGDKTESGKRRVMGRKGLGKLAGFGVAEQVEVWTKRKDQTYATTILMDYGFIKQHEIMNEVTFEPQYHEGLDVNLQGTKIILKKLRCDSFKSKGDKLEELLSRNFYIAGDDFQILLNNSLVMPPDVDYEFMYPQNNLDASGLAKIDVKVDDDFSYPVLASVKFRARKLEGQNDGKVRGSLSAHLRGARIYCNGRLAAGPTLLNLDSGMHNFHAQDYMECIVHADVLDQQEADLIGTNRSGFKTDNEIVDALTVCITELMKKAIYEHSKYRDAAAEKEIEQDPKSKAILDAVAQLSKKNREPAKQILKSIANSEGIDSPAYNQVAPYLVKAINSSEILIDLVKTGVNPESLPTIIDQLVQLKSIERSDVLKVYQARRNAIDGLQKLEERSHGPRGPRYENELQKLLKENGWLIRGEFDKYLTSDEEMGEVARKLNEKLKVDGKAPENSEQTDTRPDLVFVLVDPHAITNVSVVELKSPNVPLTNDHLTQLKAYMMEIEEIIKNDYDGTANVTGCLIGNLPRPDTQSTSAKLLLQEIQNAGPHTKWEVLTLPKLLDRARKSHHSIIEALKAEEEKEAEDEVDAKKARTPPVLAATLAGEA